MRPAAHRVFGMKRCCNLRWPLRFRASLEQMSFPSLQQKAARLAYGLVSNHPFIDGNKRIGAHAMLVFLELNGIVLEYSQNELSDLFLSVAASQSEL